MKYDYIYDSSKMSGEKDYNFKNDYHSSNILSSFIYFEKENLYLEVDEVGNAVFFDTNGKEIYRDKAIGEVRYFFEVYCSIKE